MSDNILSIKAEEESYTDDALYNITSFGSDMMLSQIITMYEDGDIEKPDLQRNYVWNKIQASRFIDSILLGLPVPSIFLAKDKNNHLLIVDGFQRITTISDYVKGVFSPDHSVFKLSNRDIIYERWRDKSYFELSDAEKRAIRTYSIHAIIFEQKEPSDDSGMYQIFERINTGGQILRPQEIRNSIYHGSFNDLLKQLNRTASWRKVLGSSEPDSRMSDVELVLRFFAFIDIQNQIERKQNQINLVKYLNSYMSGHCNIGEEKALEYQQLFLTIIDYLTEHIGIHLFRTAKETNDGKTVWAKKINPVVFDAVCTATYYEKQKTKKLPSVSLEDRYQKLVLDPEFGKVTRQRTTNVENIQKRVNIAEKVLFDF